MNRKDVDELLKEFIGVGKRHAESLDEFYKEFQSWNNALQKSIKFRRTGKNDVPNIPPTPGAPLRIRRRLSTIGEYSDGDGADGSRNKRTSKSALSIGKSSPKHRSKRAKLSFDEENIKENISSTTENIRQDTQRVSSEKTEETCLKYVQADNDVNEETEGKRGRSKGRRTKRSTILGRNLPVPKRNTRSNARITRSTVTPEVYNDNGSSLNSFIVTSLSKSTQKIGVTEDESAGQRDRRGQRTKQSSSVKQVECVSTGLSKSSAGPTQSVKHDVSNDGRNSRSVTKIVPENDDSQGKRLSNNDETRDQSRKTQNTTYNKVDDFSQDSLNVSITSHSFTSKTTEERNDGIETYVSICESSSGNVRKSQNPRAVSKITQDSLNVSSVNSETIAPANVSDKCSAINEQSRNSSLKSRKSANSEETERASKMLRLCITRIDEVHDITGSIRVSDEFFKGGNVQGDNGRSKSEDAKRSLCAVSISETQNNISYIDQNCSSKKKLIDEEAEEVNFVKTPENVNEMSDARSQGRASQKSRKSLRLLSNLLPAGNAKKNAEFVEVSSFAEISMPSSEMKGGNDSLFEELHEHNHRSHINNNADSGKGSSECGLESSEYYSLVDADDKDANTSSQKKCTNKDEEGPKQSSGKKREDPLHVIPECTTPTTERTTSRKGGRSPALFSAYANEPVKNRVAAYEGLSTLTEEVQVPVTNKRVTRTKTRAMAAAAAAAEAAATATNFASQHKMNNSNRKSIPTLKISKASWRYKKKMANSAKKNDASKENSFQLDSSKNDRYYKNISGTGGKILADVNGLFSPVLNNSRKTPMTGPRTIPVNKLSANQLTKPLQRPGVILCNISTFVKPPVMNTRKDAEIKKIEEQKKREEKEREAIRRREEQLKKQAEERKKKRDEMRLRVQENREAQEKEKQESQLRVGKEKDEKWHILQQEREAKQKGAIPKKKLESERKAAEARRKLEEAEAARIAKLKAEKLQHKKEMEEAAEKERLKHIAEEKEAAFIRAKTEQKAKELAKAAKERAGILKNTVPKPPVKVVDSTFTKPLDSTFTKPLDSTFTKPLDSSFSKKTLNFTYTAVNKTNQNNAYNLEDFQSEDSDDEEELPKKAAPWATKPELLQCSGRELRVSRKASEDLCAPEHINISAIFPRKAHKRTSSAIWNTPPRYSVLPKY